MHDFHSLILAVFSSDIRFVVSLEWIIFAPRLIAGELIVNCRNATFYGFCYILKAIFLFSLNCYFVALAFGKMRELFSFFSYCHSIKFSDSNAKSRGVGPLTTNRMSTGEVGK